VRKTVSVTAGLRLTPPAVLIDLATITNIPADSHSVQHLLSVMAKQIAKLSIVTDLANLNKIVVGPNAIALSEPRPILRVGVWIVDADFPQLELQPALTPDFPFARLTDEAAAECFGLAPLLSPPPPGAVPPADNPMLGFAM